MSKRIVERPVEFLSEGDHSMAADLCRAAIEIRLNIGDRRIYNPEDVPLQMALAERLDEHALVVLGNAGLERSR